MSSKITKDTIQSSLEEFQNYRYFEKKTQETNNFSFRSNPNAFDFESSTLGEKKEKYDFFRKYRELSTSNIAEGFYLEEELAKQIKLWHSTNEEFKLPVLTMDNFFNEENIKYHLLKDIYVKNNPPIATYYLIDYLISILEEKSFDKILNEGITTYQEENQKFGLIGPVIDRDFIYYLLKEDIDEKLNNLYKENSLGYSYIAEKIITFDLFIIYLILKNYPFYILRRERLEEIFNKLKKFKSFPYPIGSIGMDLFKLLIKELYLPGVTLFQEIREIFLLDIIDPKILEINCNDFIKVIAFSMYNNIYGMSCDKNKNNIINENISINMDNNKGNYKSKNEGKSGNKNDFKLNDLKDFTFTSYGVYASYILYSGDNQKEEKESSYLVDILGLFEKRYKVKKEEESSKDNISEKNEKKDEEAKEPNISEKNVINNLFNLIDSGLDSKFVSFSNDIKVINDKLYTKTKEIHETTNNSPKDNINLRRFLNHKITFLNNGLLEKKIKRFIPKKVVLEEEKSKLNSYQKYSKKNDKNNIYNDLDSKFNKTNNINNIINEENEIEEEDEEIEKIKEKKECLNSIKKYKKILDDESRVNSDGVLDNYVNNFVSLKAKYFWHLKKFETKNLEFSSEQEKKNVFLLNIITEHREVELSELYNQKYLITEDQFLDFIKLLFVWKTNINPLYHKKLYEEFIENERKKTGDKKNNKNSLLKDFDIFEDDFPENDKDFSNIPLNYITKLRDELEKIFKSKLYFNNRIYLLPGRINKSITKHISRNDYIYKSTIGDLFMNYYNQANSKDIEEIIQMPLQIYLKEAKHFYDLKVFKALIETKDPNNNYMKLNLYKYYYLLYGGIHIEINEEEARLTLDDHKNIIFKNDNKILYIDIINIYNFDSDKEENSNNNKKINDIERYLIYPISDKFQIFVSAAKDNPNSNLENETQNQYFQKYIGNLLNFDVQSAYYEAKKIILTSENFTLIPTFIENVCIKNCNYFEITLDNNNDKKESNDEEDEEDENNVKLFDNEEITKIFETDKTTSFNVKISSFIDLESNNH